MKFHLAIFGCQMNSNDADRIRTILTNIGGIETKQREEADIIIYITCSIRQHAEDRIFGMIAKEKGKIIALTGCMVRKTSSQISPKRDRLLIRSKKIDLVFRINDAPQLPLLLREYFPIPKEFSEDFPGIFQTFPTQKQHYSAFVPISTGCDHRCTYCIVPYTRGKEICRSHEEILEECKRMIDLGAQEITLLGQNVNRYYFGKRRTNPYRTDFAELLDTVAKIKGLKWLRFLSPHPQHLGEDVLDVMANNKNICRHLHLPVQSGDNEILKKMARGYTVEKFQTTLKMARKKIPKISVTTDIIVGFCGETETEFQNSKKLCEEEEFDKIFIGKFSVRPNTPAEKWEDSVSPSEKKRRFHEINEILKKTSQKRNKEEIGQTKNVLVEAIEKDAVGSLKGRGRTNENRGVEFPLGEGQEIKVGTFIPIKITNAKIFFLEGEVI
jgi:tRNA-2-methylthio-N6-dimethylallyladenosine synthase